MKHIAAYMIAVLAGHHRPDRATVASILESGGVAADAEALDKLFHEVEGKKIDDIIALGKSKMTAMPAVAAAGPAAPAAAAAAAPAAGKAAPKEEPKEEEEDGDMGFSLFD